MFSHVSSYVEEKKRNEVDMSELYGMQENNIDKGKLKIQITSEATSFPVEDANIRISYTGVPDQTVETVTTDSSGQTETLELAAPPVEYSLDERQKEQPYAEYTLEVTAPGFESVQIAGAEILSGVTALQNIQLLPLDRENKEEVFVIPAHTLFGNYPPKIPEAEIKPVNESGEIVLSRVVVPEYIVVHDGSPRDSTALNYYEKYKDYIKNVASSEIYATWPEESIKANVLAIMSFTLNRVYTEWYRNQGFEFTISSSTAFDHKWIPQRNIYDTISRVVDDLFASYLSRPNIRQPILTQYCDGKQVSCPGWMTQWGSKNLADQGYSAIQILRYFYGSDMYINTAKEISGIPASWPGYTLENGSSGNKVRQMQEQLNVIAGAYPALPKIDADGIYGPRTEEAVRKFQEVFGLPQTGKVDYRTWYKISEIYVGVSRIAELV